uniref:NADH-ubiquinone oxidoreductase chain 4 n=1 Tax=Hemiarthrum setulosum TaxID=1437515 RepID=A0A6H1PG50_9MOLL|nr:NADH dehydrogenase subunit 4 [Hemiarthrum setulosum]
MLTLLVISSFLTLSLNKFNFKWHITLWTTLVMFSFTATLLFSPMGTPKVFQFMFTDTISTPLIMLSSWITALMIVSSYKIIINNKKTKFFLLTVVTLNLMIMFMFSQSTLIMMYIFFEASLIPTLILILNWGYQPERLQAGMYLIIYTVFGALPFLVNIMFIMKMNGHLNLILPTISPFFPNKMAMNIWWLFMLLAFLIKLPMYGVHLWLPKAHVEAPVSGSMILAGLLLKLGGYGIIRVTMMFFKTNILMNSLIISVSLLGGVISSFICIRQKDMKSLIAYSSIGHMSLMLVGVLSGTSWGLIMSLMMMVAHGLSSSGLFCIANMLYEKTGSRSMFISKGALSLIPNFSLCFFLLASLNMAAPPSLNLLSEVGLIITSLSFSTIFSIPLTLMSFMSAVYSLFLYTSTQHGKISSFTNPFSSVSSTNFFIIFFHWIPAQILLMLADLI